MAKEITALNSVRERNGETRWRLFYHFPIAPMIVDAQANKVAPQRSADIPGDAAAYVDQAVKAAIDAGDAGFATREVTQTPGESGASFINRLKLDWAATRDFHVQTWRDQNANKGTQVTAP